MPLCVYTFRVVPCLALPKADRSSKKSCRLCIGLRNWKAAKAQQIIIIVVIVIIGEYLKHLRRRVQDIRHSKDNSN